MEIAENALKGKKMRFTWIMHEKTDLLDSIGNIRTSKCKILQGTIKTSIKSRIRNRRSMWR